jgi:C1A family cysteine protease
VLKDLPSKFDWRDQVTLPPIRNQRNCGSCWSFSVLRCVESAYIIQKSVDPIKFDLAEQTLVSSCEQGGSCRGGYFTALNYVRDKGVPFESEDPYTARNSSCKAPFDETNNILKWYYVGAPGREPTLDELKSALITYGPLSVTVNGSFYGYASGVYNKCNRNSTNHMVTITSYDDETQSWGVDNSWGTGFGEKGKIRMRYHDKNGKKCNRIGERAAYVIIE